MNPDQIQAFVLTFAQSHPAVASLIAFMGACRVAAKPISSIVHGIVELTPSQRDDGLLTSFLAWFQTPLGIKVAYGLDWLTSIKIVPPAKPIVVVVTPAK